MGVTDHCHVLAALRRGKRPGTHCTEDWLDPRAGAENLASTRTRSPVCPARSESLHCLHYPRTQAPVIVVRFESNFNFLKRFSKKPSNIKLHENPSTESRVVPCGQTDRHKEANSRFSQFCEKRLLTLLSIAR
jgi:hypothetical protein